MSFRVIFFSFTFFSAVWPQKKPQTDTSFQQHKRGVHGHACVRGVLQCREPGDPKAAGAETVVKMELPPTRLRQSGWGGGGEQGSLEAMDRTTP